MWTKVINSKNPLMKPVDIRISNDIYWALTSALEDDDKNTTINEFCDTAQNGDGDGYSAWHALVKSMETKECKVIMAEALSQQLNKMRMENKTI